VTPKGTEEKKERERMKKKKRMEANISPLQKHKHSLVVSE
jgi:hypothetical protein